MPDTSPLLKHVIISLNFLCIWSGLLSIVYQFISQVNNLWCFMLVLKLIKWSRMPRILNCLDGSRQIKTLISLLLEHIISFIRTFQRTLSGSLTMLCIWKIRQRYKVIGCMYAAYPNQGEIFYLRLLLTMVKGKIDHNHDIYR